MLSTTSTEEKAYFHRLAEAYGVVAFHPQDNISFEQNLFAFFLSLYSQVLLVDDEIQIEIKGSLGDKINAKSPVEIRQLVINELAHRVSVTAFYNKLNSIPDDPTEADEAEAYMRVRRSKVLANHLHLYREAERKLLPRFIAEAIDKKIENALTSVNANRERRFSSLDEIINHTFADPTVLKKLMDEIDLQLHLNPYVVVSNLFEKNLSHLLLLDYMQNNDFRNQSAQDITEIILGETTKLKHFIDSSREEFSKTFTATNAEQFKKSVDARLNELSPKELSELLSDRKSYIATLLKQTNESLISSKELYNSLEKPTAAQRRSTKRDSEQIVSRITNRLNIFSSKIPEEILETLATHLSESFLALFAAFRETNKGHLSKRRSISATEMVETHFIQTISDNVTTIYNLLDAALHNKEMSESEKIVVKQNVLKKLIADWGIFIVYMDSKPHLPSLQKFIAEAVDETLTQDKPQDLEVTVQHLPPIVTETRLDIIENLNSSNIITALNTNVSSLQRLSQDDETLTAGELTNFSIQAAKLKIEIEKDLIDQMSSHKTQQEIEASPAFKLAVKQIGLMEKIKGFVMQVRTYNAETTSTNTTNNNSPNQLAEQTLSEIKNFDSDCNDLLTPDVPLKKIVLAFAIAGVCTVLGGLVGATIGILAGSWTGYGAALTGLCGLYHGVIAGAALGVAFGAAATGVTVELGLLYYLYKKPFNVGNFKNSATSLATNTQSIFAPRSKNSGELPFHKIETKPFKKKT